MARLIDAKAGKKAFCAIAQPAEYRGVIHMVVPISEIDKFPTVDAVEVVRCKDCIHWYKHEKVCLKIYSDGALSAYAWQSRNHDDFCSYGERKDGDWNG